VRGRSAWAVAVVTLAALVAGCASIPDGGAVVAGDRVRPEGPGQLRVIPPDPEPGANPAEIVAGFIGAAAQGDRGLEGARKYLTEDANRQWVPGDRIVYSGPLGELSVYDDGRRATVTVTPVAVIDTAGRYEPVVPGPPALPPNEYTLTTVDGEWRLSEVPAAVLVAEVDLDRLLAPYRVYFGDRSGTGSGDLGRYLVPDVRWFPPTSESATALVRAVLDGPSAPLEGSVEWVSIPDLAITDLGVAVKEGVATVDLNEVFTQADDREDRLLRLQLEETLTALPGVSSVRISVEGRATRDPATGAEPGTEPDVKLTRPLVLRRPVATESATPAPTPGEADPSPPGQDLGAEPTVPATAVDRPRIEQVGESGEPAEIERLRRLAERIDDGLSVSPLDSGVAAGRAEGETSIWASTPTGNVQRVVADGVGLTPPSFDDEGWLWTVTQATAPLVATGATTEPQWSGPAAIAVKDGERVEYPLSRLLVATDTVTTFRLSRDGSRALLVVQGLDGDRTVLRVLVVGVVRDAGQRPRSLSVSAFRLLPDLVDAVDGTWVSADVVAVLGTDDDGGLRPFVARVGGTVIDELPPTDGARSITAGRGERLIVVGRSDGTVVSREGRSWSRDPQPGWSPSF